MVTRLPLLAGMLLSSVFALFHCYAHGAEASAGSHFWQYALGFASTSLLLQLGGYLLGRRLPSPAELRLCRLSSALLGRHRHAVIEATRLRQPRHNSAVPTSSNTPRQLATTPGGFTIPTSPSGSSILDICTRPASLL
ncbi:HupE/UreJ family protein [Neisseriaceae bacterium TC5R-5]|nr:HupE/UreJ family protein [Neisseriaceae bacterium TC5R-5]